MPKGWQSKINRTEVNSLKKKEIEKKLFIKHARFQPFFMPMKPKLKLLNFVNYQVEFSSQSCFLI